jgi:hypothetical protein
MRDQGLLRKLRACSIAALACLLLSVGGCGGGPSQKDYLPAEERARAALESALGAWQNGQPIGQVAGAGSTVQVVDSQWKAGRRLAGYQIVNAEMENVPPRFTVKLQVQGAAEQEVRYLVVGIDPLWVYREDDYQSSMGMN